jgi:deoxyribodipyrimidine photo-lyase
LPRFEGPTVPPSRIRQLNARKPQTTRQYVLYWMTSARRLGWNFALQHAVDRALELRRPLLILEALRCDYPGANDRLHRFILDGMAVNRRRAAPTRARYYPYVEPARHSGSELLTTLAGDACLVVGDWYPAFFLPRMLAAAAAKIDVPLEAVDTNGLIPLAEHERAFAAARFYRGFAQKRLLEHFTRFPEAQPLRRLRGGPAIEALPRAIASRWPQARDRLLSGAPGALTSIPLDHSIAPVAMRGGTEAAERALRSFVDTGLARYGTERNDPDAEATSRLSPYLHFGHLSAHEVFSAIATRERWTSRRLGKTRRGARDGWWGMSPSADAFLDQLVVWRELAFNGCEYIPRYDRYPSLPPWAQATIESHRADRRPHRYTLAQLEQAATHDPIWNAAQRELLTEGWFHGYMRMLWGKKIVEWSKDGAEALGRMRSLMDRYSLDGRDPNAYAGYAWVLGRYDRPWPERPIFGTIRYMTSESAKRKLKMRGYLLKYGSGL